MDKKAVRALVVLALSGEYLRASIECISPLSNIVGGETVEETNGTYNHSSGKLLEGGVAIRTFPFIPFPLELVTPPWTLTKNTWISAKLLEVMGFSSEKFAESFPTKNLIYLTSSPGKRTNSKRNASPAYTTGFAQYIH